MKLKQIVIIVLFLLSINLVYALPSNAKVLYAENESDLVLGPVQMTTYGELKVDINGTFDNVSWNESYGRSIFALIGAGSDNQSWNETYAKTLFADINVVDTNETTRVDALYVNITAFLTDLYYPDTNETTRVDALYANVSAFLTDGVDNASWNETYGESLFVDVTGDTMTGDLIVDAGLNVTGNSWFDGTLLPITTLLHDIGSGANRWRKLYVTNVSADYISIINDFVALGDVTATNYYGSGAYLTNLNVTGDITGYALNISFLFGHAGIGAIDLRGDPWYVSGTDLEINNDLKVNNTEIENNLTVGDAVIANQYCNSTDCYTVTDFLTVASSSDNSSWNETYAKTLFADISVVDTNETTRVNTLFTNIATLGDTTWTNITNANTSMKTYVDSDMATLGIATWTNITNANDSMKIYVDSVSGGSGDGTGGWINDSSTTRTTRDVLVQGDFYMNQSSGNTSINFTTVTVDGENHNMIIVTSSTGGEQEPVLYINGTEGEGVALELVDGSLIISNEIDGDEFAEFGLISSTNETEIISGRGIVLTPGDEVGSSNYVNVEGYLNATEDICITGGNCLSSVSGGSGDGTGGWTNTTIMTTAHLNASIKGNLTINESINTGWYSTFGNTTASVKIGHVKYDFGGGDITFPKITMQASADPGPGSSELGFIKNGLFLDAEPTVEPQIGFFNASNPGQNGFLSFVPMTDSFKIGNSQEQVLVSGNFNVSSGKDVCITGGNCLSTVSGGSGSGNCSVAGSCSNISYMDYENEGSFNITTDGDTQFNIGWEAIDDDGDVSNITMITANATGEWTNSSNIGFYGADGSYLRLFDYGSYDICDSTDFNECGGFEFADDGMYIYSDSTGGIEFEMDEDSAYIDQFGNINLSTGRDICIDGGNCLSSVSGDNSSWNESHANTLYARMNVENEGSFNITGGLNASLVDGVYLAGNNANNFMKLYNHQFMGGALNVSTLMGSIDDGGSPETILGIYGTLIMFQDTANQGSRINFLDNELDAEAQISFYNASQGSYSNYLTFREANGYSFDNSINVTSGSDVCIEGGGNCLSTVGSGGGDGTGGWTNDSSTTRTTRDVLVQGDFYMNQSSGNTSINFTTVPVDGENHNMIIVTSSTGGEQEPTLYINGTEGGVTLEIIDGTFSVSDRAGGEEGGEFGFIDSTNETEIIASRGIVMIPGDSVGSANYVNVEGYLNATEDICITGGNCLSSVSGGSGDGTGGWTNTTIMTTAHLNASIKGNLTINESINTGWYSTFGNTTASVKIGHVKYDFGGGDITFPKITMQASADPGPGSSELGFIKNGLFLDAEPTVEPQIGFFNASNPGQNGFLSFVPMTDSFKIGNSQEQVLVSGNFNVSSGKDVCITGGNCLSTVSGGSGDGTGGWTNTSIQTSTTLNVSIAGELNVTENFHAYKDARLGTTLDYMNVTQEILNISLFAPLAFPIPIIEFYSGSDPGVLGSNNGAIKGKLIIMETASSEPGIIFVAADNNSIGENVLTGLSELRYKNSKSFLYATTSLGVNTGSDNSKIVLSTSDFTKNATMRYVDSTDTLNFEYATGGYTFDGGISILGAEGNFVFSDPLGTTDTSNLYYLAATDALYFLAATGGFIFNEDLSTTKNLDVTQNISVTGNINMGISNITSIDCLTFNSGGKICSVP